MPYLQAKEESELPEYILGTVRLNRVRLESAVPFEVWGDLQRVFKSLCTLVVWLITFPLHWGL